MLAAHEVHPGSGVLGSLEPDMQKMLQHANNRFLRDMLLEEVHTDRFLVISRKNALAVTLDHTGFAHCPIANNHHLQKRVDIH